MIEVMAQVERDLKAGRYQNALRQRHVLADGLGNVKQYLEGEFEVRQDATANLPDRHPEGNPRQHARPLARRLGGAQPPVLRAAAPAAEKRDGASRREAGSEVTARWKIAKCENCKLQD